MRIHVKFRRGAQRNFLLRVQQKSGLSVEGLAKVAHIGSRNYRDWKREKLTMTLDAAVSFQSIFGINLPEKIGPLQNRWKENRYKISKKGGLSHYLKYGNPGTPEGRRRGGSKALAILRARGIIPEKNIYKVPLKKSIDLAELVGILLGDGGITPTQITIAVNSIADKNYVPFIKNLLRKLFKFSFKSFKKNDCNAVTIYVNSVFLVDYLTKIGLRPGNKVKLQVGVPDWIKISRQYRIACLRGLMDTDGGVFLHKYRVNGNLYVYKKICFSNRSIPLLNFVYRTLLDLGFVPKMISKVENKKVWLYNKNEVEGYLQIVGTHNSRLLKYQT